MEKSGTLCDTITTHRVQLSNFIGGTPLASVIEDGSRHARLDQPRAKGIDTNVSESELPRRCLHDRIYAGHDGIDVSG
jgi:hypothetical protein